jgi:hypothetical protein
MTLKNIFGWTPVGLAPPFVSVNQRTDLSYAITVRGPGQNGACGPAVEITIPAPELAKLSEAIHEHFNP